MPHTYNISKWQAVKINEHQQYPRYSCYYSAILKNSGTTSKSFISLLTRKAHTKLHRQEGRMSNRNVCVQTTHRRDAVQVFVLHEIVLEEGAPDEPRAPTHRRDSAQVRFLHQDFLQEGAFDQSRQVSIKNFGRRALPLYRNPFLSPIYCLVRLFPLLTTFVPRNNMAILSKFVAGSRYTSLLCSRCMKQ